jgi:predicted polyphosphate/ATP-dependent NAD kinase
MELGSLASKVFKDNPKGTIGFIVNPIAGMGGAVGLKGTDGEDILEKAVILGATPVAPSRAEIFLSELKTIQTGIHIKVGAGQMGEEEAKNQGYIYSVFGEKKSKTNKDDTETVAKEIVDNGVDILIFCGGDGTARNILNAVDRKLPVLGVPTGVKMHSAIFAIDPKSAARITSHFLWKQLPIWEAEVMDIDEKAFREGRVSAKLYGYLLSPYEPNLIQGAKMASPITENMEDNIIYIVSAGTTTRTIGDILNQKKTLLGVDLFYNKKIIAKDVNENQILEAIKNKTAKIVVTPIGGQGFIFGRGNQQISPKIIRKVGKNNIIVIATENKMKNLKKLKVDTGDTELDSDLQGTMNVITDYKIATKVPIE